MALFQKPLGWVQRFLYNVEQGAIPFPQPTLSVDWDWPLQYEKTTTTLTSVNGTVQTTLFTMGAEKHCMLVHFTANFSSGGVAGDVIFVTLDLGAASQRIYTMNAFAVAHGVLPIIGAKTNLGGATAVEMTGLPPLYVPPGASVILGLQSGTAGSILGLNAIRIERLKSYPLRLP